MDSQRTHISLLKTDDFNEALDIFLAKDALKYIEPLLNLTPDEHLERFQQKHDEIEEGLCYHWACRLKENNELISLLNLKTVAGTDRMFLGYIIKKEYWGIGLATELSSWVVQYVKDNLKKEKLYALIESDNIASRKILEKLGFIVDDIKMENNISVETLVLSL